jgi:hypothetical protein
MNNLKLLSLILLPCTLTAATPFDGLTGREILSKINLTMRPTSYAEHQTGSDGAWATVSAFTVNNCGVIVDYFDPDNSTVVADPPSGIFLTNIAPADWWGTNSKYDKLPRLDLHNIVTAGSDVDRLKSDLPQGRVTSATYDNGTWSVGTGKYYGADAPMYTPPRGREGDFARSLMYCAVMYPMELWCGKGYYLLADGDYPLLSDYGKQLLMAWHRADPVDDFELKRDSIISERQGNSNPFVTYPGLAEYIWGDKAGETFGDNTTETPDESDEQPTVKPLKANYSISVDQYISLSSPYLPEDLSWTIDGINATATTISLDTLTEGEHLLQYSNSELTGIIKIFITK